MKGNNMSDNKNVNQDKGLQGNEKIEQAIAAYAAGSHSGNAGTYTDCNP